MPAPTDPESFDECQKDQSNSSCCEEGLWVASLKLSGKFTEKPIFFEKLEVESQNHRIVKKFQVKDISDLFGWQELKNIYEGLRNEPDIIIFASKNRNEAVSFIEGIKAGFAVANKALQSACGVSYRGLSGVGYETLMKNSVEEENHGECDYE